MLFAFGYSARDCALAFLLSERLCFGISSAVLKDPSCTPAQKQQAIDKLQAARDAVNAVKFGQVPGRGVPAAPTGSDADPRMLALREVLDAHGQLLEVQKEASRAMLNLLAAATMRSSDGHAHAASFTHCHDGIANAVGTGCQPEDWGAALAARVTTQAQPQPVGYNAIVATSGGVGAAVEEGQQSDSASPLPFTLTGKWRGFAYHPTAGLREDDRVFELQDAPEAGSEGLADGKKGLHGSGSDSCGAFEIEGTLRVDMQTEEQYWRLTCNRVDSKGPPIVHTIFASPAHVEYSGAGVLIPIVLWGVWAIGTGGVLGIFRYARAM